MYTQSFSHIGDFRLSFHRLGAAVALMEAREQVGMTQEQLAKEAHVSRITIARIERGRISPSFRTLSALAGAMGKRLKVEII